jgi:hypothetical protein
MHAFAVEGLEKQIDYCGGQITKDFITIGS